MVESVKWFKETASHVAPWAGRNTLTQTSLQLQTHYCIAMLDMDIAELSTDKKRALRGDERVGGICQQIIPLCTPNRCRK